MTIALLTITTGRAIREKENQIENVSNIRDG
jgi:hypothetical protein